MLLPHFHGRILALSLLAALVVGLPVLLSRPRTPAQDPPAAIAVEHASSAGLSIALTMRQGLRAIDFDQKSDEEMFISVPQDWRRTEVRGAPLSAITGEEPAMGFRRWNLPPRAGLSFKAEGRWEHLIVHNPTKTPLKLDVTRVNLDTEETAHDAVLMLTEPVRVP